MVFIWSLSKKQTKKKYEDVIEITNSNDVLAVFLLDVVRLWWVYQVIAIKLSK